MDQILLNVKPIKVYQELKKLDGTTHPCTAEQCGGGVGRNIAEALWRLLKGRTKLLTAIGDDADGRYLSNIAPGIILDGCVTNKGRTPTYAAVLDSKGECVLGLGDMGLHNHITIELVNKHMDVLKQAPIVVLDGNVPQSTIDYVLQICEQLKKPGFHVKTINSCNCELNTIQWTAPSKPFFNDHLEKILRSEEKLKRGVVAGKQLVLHTIKIYL